VADTYDAMTSSRPYRNALPHEVAVAEIREGSGSQFCPQVVAAFEGLVARDALTVSSGQKLLEALIAGAVRQTP
ncbi:MAG: hypothetical protein AAFY88_26705, partial [Acidobacteriota bacterium]